MDNCWVNYEVREAKDLCKSLPWFLTPRYQCMHFEAIAHWILAEALNSQKVSKRQATKLHKVFADSQSYSAVLIFAIRYRQTDFQRLNVSLFVSKVERFRSTDPVRVEGWVTPKF